MSRTFEWSFPVGGTYNRLRCKIRRNWRRRCHKKNPTIRNTSAPRIEAIAIAAMAPRDVCDEEPEIGFVLARAIRIPSVEIAKKLCTYDCDDAVVTLIEPMDKLLFPSLVIFSVCGTLLLSPVRKNSVVASLAEDSPLRVTVSLSNCTENGPDSASRNPKTVTAVPGDSSAYYG